MAAARDPNVFFDDANGVVSTNRLIYHYTSTSAGAAILTGGRLRMGPFTRTNDPREQKEWFPTVINQTGGTVSSEESWSICREVDLAMRGRVKLGCFTRDRGPDPALLGVGNFHRGWARARMWHQYATGHAGLCLILNRSRWQAAVDEVVAALVASGVDADRPVGPLTVHGDVTYLDQPVDWDGALGVEVSDYRARGPVAIADECIRANIAGFFLRKNTDWVSEQEYRTLIIATGEDYVDVPLRECLSGVMVGAHYPDPELRVLRYRLSQLGLDDLDVAKCAWQRGAPDAFPVGD